MDVVYWLIPIVLIIGFLVVLIFIWMAKSGQFDDLDGAANSIFMDYDEMDFAEKTEPKSTKQPNSNTESTQK